MIASPTDTDPARTTLADTALPIPAHFPPDWPHHLVVDMLKPGLDFRALAAHIGVSFTALAELINSPQVQAETNALNDLTQTRARLLALSAGPRSINKLITIVDAPLPHNTGMTPEAESRAWCRHADLAIRAINALTRHTRPSPPPNHSGPKHTSPNNTKPDNTQKNRPPAPSNPTPDFDAPEPNAPDSLTPTSDPAEQRAAVARVPSAAAQRQASPWNDPPAAAPPCPKGASSVERAEQTRLTSSFPDDPSAFNTSTGASDTEPSDPTQSSSSPLPIAHSPLPSSQHSSAAPRPGESSIRVEPSSESHYTRHARDRPAA